jgi:cytochrome P450
MAKLNAEIDNADQEGKLSNPVSYRKFMNHLPYLQAALKEAMRLHPSIGLILEREVPKGGVTICDRHIPGETVVGINAWVLHRDARVFPDPDKFIPERWMDSDPQLLKKMEQSFFAFGAGPGLALARTSRLSRCIRLSHSCCGSSGFDCTAQKRGGRRRMYSLCSRKD